MSFGKDYRLVGEATVTGEKYRAGTTFWSALAHTDIVGRIKQMVEHYAVIGDLIDKPLVYDRKELIEWLTSRASNCLHDYPYFIPGDKLVKPGEVYSPSVHPNKTDHTRFKSEFYSKMKEIGLGWKEFQLYYRMYLNRYYLRPPEPSEQDWVEKEGGYICFKYDGQDRTDQLFGQCISPELFVKILDEIAANRRRLCELPVAVPDTRP